MYLKNARLWQGWLFVRSEGIPFIDDVTNHGFPKYRLRVEGNGKFCWGIFYQVVESEEEWFWPFKPFSKLKTTFCKYWTSIKMKSSKEYEKYKNKIKMVQEQWLFQVGRMSKFLDSVRAYCSSLLCAIIARIHLPFFKIFSNFVRFCPNFQICCPFLPFFALFLKNHTHALTF